MTAGLIAQYTVLVFPTGAFPDNVSFSCSALPSGAACNFSNTTVTLNGSSSGSSVLNLTTTAQPVSTVSSAGWRRSLYALAAALFALVLLQPSCSSKKTPVPVSGTPSGIYPLTVTVTSGSFSKSVPFQLTVTP